MYRLTLDVTSWTIRTSQQTSPSVMMVTYTVSASEGLLGVKGSVCVCRADVYLPLDVQLAFGTPHHPMSSQRFASSDQRLSLATMTYVSSFIRSG